MGVSSPSAFKGRRFAEFGVPGAFSTVESKTGNVVTINGNGYNIRSNAMVYSLDSNGLYSVSSVSNLRTDSQVRLYDVSDDKDDSVDIVILKE